MKPLVRTQIFLTQEHRNRLRTWSRIEKKAASELIRAAIEERYVRGPLPEEIRETLAKAFGSWKGRRKSSVSIVRALRRGERLKRLYV